MDTNEEVTTEKPVRKIRRTLEVPDEPQVAEEIARPSERKWMNAPDVGTGAASPDMKNGYIDEEGVLFMSYAKDLLVFLGQTDSPFQSEKNPMVQFIKRRYFSNDLEKIASLRRHVAFGGPIGAEKIGEYGFWEGGLPQEVLARIREDESLLTFVKEDHEITNA